MSSDPHKNAVLSDLGVTEVEYNAMICPYYGVPLGLREMASWTVLENDAGSSDDCVTYSADDYLAALEGMLCKGWLCLKSDAQRDPEEEEDIPAEQDECPSPAGTVVFTAKGYRLHRRMIRALRGNDFVDSVDAFANIDRVRFTIRYYARTRRMCKKWIREITQIAGPENISERVGHPAEILAVSGPRKIGRWRASPFLTHPAGYTVVVQYKRKRRQRLCIPELEVDAWFDNLKPVHVSGTVACRRFSFFDLPAWTAPTYLDEDAIFHWVFEIRGPPRKEVPQHAILTGEATAAGGYGIADVLYELRESEEGERDWMLDLSEARDVVAQCVTTYVEEKRLLELQGTVESEGDSTAWREARR